MISRIILTKITPPECIKKIAAIPVIAAIICSVLCFPVMASGTYQDPDTGYTAVISDDDDNLSAAEETALIETMKPVLKYGNAAYVVTNDSHDNSEAYADECFTRFFGPDYVSGALLLVDKEMVYLMTDGFISKTVTSDKALSITDNVYIHATHDDYYSCGSLAFKQVYTLLDGHIIPEPMKYICNLLISLMIGFLIAYYMVYRSYRITDANKSDELENSRFKVMAMDVQLEDTGKSETSSITSAYGSYAGSYHSSGHHSHRSYHSSNHHSSSSHRSSSSHHSSSSHRSSSSHHSSSHHRSGGGHRR